MPQGLAGGAPAQGNEAAKGRCGRERGEAGHARAARSGPPSDLRGQGALLVLRGHRTGRSQRKRDGPVGHRVRRHRAKSCARLATAGSSGADRPDDNAHVRVDRGGNASLRWEVDVGAAARHRDDTDRRDGTTRTGTGEHDPHDGAGTPEHDGAHDHPDDGSADDVHHGPPGGGVGF